MNATKGAGSVDPRSLIKPKKTSSMDNELERNVVSDQGRDMEDEMHEHQAQTTLFSENSDFNDSLKYERSIDYDPDDMLFSPKTQSPAPEKQSVYQATRSQKLSKEDAAREALLNKPYLGSNSSKSGHIQTGPARLPEHKEVYARREARKHLTCTSKYYRLRMVRGRGWDAERKEKHKTATKAAKQEALEFERKQKQRPIDELELVEKQDKFVEEIYNSPDPAAEIIKKRRQRREKRKYRMSQSEERYYAKTLEEEKRCNALAQVPVRPRAPSESKMMEAKSNRSITEKSDWHVRHFIRNRNHNICHEFQVDLGFSFVGIDKDILASIFRDNPKKRIARHRVTRRDYMKMPIVVDSSFGKDAKRTPASYDPPVISNNDMMLEEMSENYMSVRSAALKQERRDEQEFIADSMENNTAILHIGKSMKKEVKKRMNIALANTIEALASKDIIKETGELYFIPKNMTKKACHRLFQHVANKKVKRRGRVGYGLPAKSDVLKLARMFGYKDLDEFLEKVKAGMKLKAISSIQDYNDLHETLHKPVVGDLDAEYDRKMKEARYFQHIQKNPKSEARGGVIDSTNLIDLNMTKENFIEAKTHERHIEYVLESVEGICTAQFKFDLNYTYKTYSMFSTASGTGKLPFGRTIPDLAYVYVLGLLLDPEDNLLLKKTSTAECYSLGGLTLLMKQQALEGGMNTNLIKKLGSIVNYGDSQSKIATIANMTSIFTQLSLQGNRLACLNDERDDLLNKLQATYTKIKIKEAIVDPFHALANLQIGKLRAVLGKLTGPCVTLNELKGNVFDIINIPLDTRIMPLSEKKDIFAPPVMDLAAKICSMLDEYLQVNGQKDTIKAYIFKLYEDAMIKNRGYFRYMIEVLSNKDGRSELAEKVWFRKHQQRIITIKALLAIVKREIESGDSTHSKKYAKYPGVQDYRARENQASNANEFEDDLLDGLKNMKIKYHLKTEKAQGKGKKNSDLDKRDIAVHAASMDLTDNVMKLLKSAVRLD